MATEAELVKSKVQQMLAEQELRTQQTTQQNTGTAAQADTETVFDAEANTFYAILNDEARSPEQKHEDFVKAMTYDRKKSKEENKALQKEFMDFKKFLQKNRLDEHEKTIDLTDEKNVAQLAQLFDDMFGGLDGFMTKMKWVNDILMAVHKLRVAGGADLQLGVYKEIKSDTEAKIQRKKDLAQAEIDLTDISVKVSTAQREFDELSGKKRFSLFGHEFGKPSQETLDALDKKNVELAEAKKLEEQKQAKIEKLKVAPVAETKYADFSTEKEVIAAMLSIPREEHIKNSEDLKQAAKKFIADSRKGGKEGMASLDMLIKSVEKQDDTNNQLRGIYAFMADASKEAAKANQTIEREVKTGPKGETLSARIKREAEATAIKSYIDVANTTWLNTISVVGELGKESSKIMSIKSALDNLKDNVDEQTSSGIATVAGGIATSLTAFNQAVLNERAKTVEGAAGKMNEITDLNNASMVVQDALNIGSRGDKLLEAVNQVNETIKVIEVAGAAKTQGMERAKDAAALMIEVGKELTDRLKDYQSIGTDADLQDTEGKLAGKPARKPAKSANDNPQRASRRSGKPSPKGLPSIG